MAEYRYDNVTISDLPVVATKISRIVGVMPTGLSDAENTTTVMFSADLTSQQKDTLDALMGGTNLDAIPDNTGKTTYILENVENIKTITGLDFDMYPTANGLIFQFTKSLTNQEKTALKNALGATLRQL